MAALIYILTNSAQGFRLFHILTSDCYPLSLWQVVLKVVWWYLIMALIFNSLRIKDVAHLFMDLSAICMSSLEKCLFTYAHFFNQIFFFFWLLCYMSSLYILVSCFTFKSNPFGVNFREGCEIGSSFTLGTRTTIWFNNFTSGYASKGILPSQRDICTPIFTAALFTITKTLKQPKCPLTEEWVKKMWIYIYITDCYSAIKKKKEILSFVTTGRYASEISSMEKDKYHVILLSCRI